MENLIRLEGCRGVIGAIHAYMSCDESKVRKALELGISCTGANDYGSYNIYSMMKGKYVVNICNDV